MHANHFREPKQITRLHLLREEKHISQSILALRIGISKSYLQRFEYGLTPLGQLKIDTLIKLCRALNCKPMDILGDKNGDLLK